MKVDVILLTKNSNKPYFKLVLDQLYKTIPVNRLIVVDGGSTDGTLKVVSKYPRVVIINDSHGNRATAREKGIKEVETDWFLFLDDDVILCNNWFKYAMRYMRKNVGAIQGIDIPVERNVARDYYFTIARLRKRFKKRQLPSFERGFTGDTLIRTEVVKDIKIPKCLHFYEDYFIKRYVEKKGYRWVVTSVPFCLHLRFKQNFKTFYEGNYYAYMMGFMNLRDTLISSIISPLKITAIAIHVRRVNMIPSELCRQLFTFVGVLKASLSRKEIKTYFSMINKMLNCYEGSL